MSHAPLGSSLPRTCCPTYPQTPSACLSSQMGLRTTLSPSLQGWRKISQVIGSSLCGAGELATTSVWSRPINIATTKSSLVGLPTRCSQAQASWAISHGLVPIGSARTVTRSQENVIYEIDGKPAIEVLKEYLPEQALVEDRDWMRYALSLALTAKAPNYMKDEEYVVRGVPAVRMADGSITVETEVPEGTSVWFSSRDKEKITSRVDRMARQITEQLGDDKPKLVFQFECFTRGKLLFREQEKVAPSSGFDNPLGRRCHGLVFTP